MLDRNYYVICDSGCKFESMTKEQILTAITQAVSEGTVGDIDTGFITRVKTINGIGLRFFVGTQSEYELLSEEDRQNLFAIITNDTTKESIMSVLEEMRAEINSNAEQLSKHEEWFGNAEPIIDRLINGLIDGSASKWIPYIVWAKGGVEKDDLNFIADDGTWSPDPCGSYFSYGSTEIATYSGTETITGWQLKGFHIVDDFYLQLLITRDKMFIRMGLKAGNNRIFDNFMQIAGEGTRVDEASRLSGGWVTLASSISGTGKAVNHQGLTSGVYLMSWEDFFGIHTSIMDLTTGETAVTSAFELGKGVTNGVPTIEHYTVGLSTSWVILGANSEIDTIQNIRVKRII